MLISVYLSMTHACVQALIFDSVHALDALEFLSSSSLILVVVTGYSGMQICEIYLQPCAISEHS